MIGYVPVVGDRLQYVARGGADIGASTLVIFYTTHTSILPALFVAMLSFHFWRVRKAGGVVLPPPATGGGEDEKVLFVPHLLVREVMLALVITAVVVLLGAVVGAPLGERANPGMSPNPAKAPWYFMGLQELLVHVHPVVAVVVVPCLAVLALVLLPYLTIDDDPNGTWFLSDRGRRAAGWGALVAIVVVPLCVIAHEFAAPHLPAWEGAAAVVAGLLPLAFVVAGGMAFGRFVQRRHALRRNEVTQALVVLYAVGFAALTAIGVWFRGAHMALVWPWTR